MRGAHESLLKKVMRTNILRKGKRPDGRTTDEIRPISIEVGVLPRAHGTGLFKRGQTQVLTIATLSSLSQAQILDTISPEDRKRYMHHYNFPPYSVGEVRRMGGAGRREIGHGALAERALLPVVPSQEEFPYTIRLVSEVLSSNGSTSMASVCGSALALMDAGVPIKTPVAGVAMGLIMGDDGREYAGLTDIQGIEDFQGEMDFKVAGTQEGITALHMDAKVEGIAFASREKALCQALRVRTCILEKRNSPVSPDQMTAPISKARDPPSHHAPLMLSRSVPVDKIGSIIGPGGKTIRALTSEYKVSIDVEDDGTVIVGSPNGEAAEKAMKAIHGLVKEAEVGEIYTGKVARIMDFGAFVEILPGKDGLVHISELSDHRVERVEDEVQVGDEITVMVVEIDRLGRINLSRRAVHEASSDDSPGGVPVRFQNRGEGNGRRGPGGPPRQQGGRGGRGPGGGGGQRFR